MSGTTTEAGPRGTATYADIARALGVSNNQVYMWYQRRATNGFPAPTGKLRQTTRPGQSVGQPLFDLESVEGWYAAYDPNKRRGAHWAQKRGTDG